MHNHLVVNSFSLLVLDRLVWSKWFTYQMWEYCIKNNHPLSDASLVDAAMLHNNMLYYPTLRHIDINIKVDDEGVYHHYFTGGNMSTIHCYQVRKKGEARCDRKVNAGLFWYNLIYNTFTQNIGLEENFQSSDDKSDTKYDRTTNTNIKEGGNYGNDKVDKLVV